MFVFWHTRILVFSRCNLTAAFSKACLYLRRSMCSQLSVGPTWRNPKLLHAGCAAKQSSGPRESCPEQGPAWAQPSALSIIPRALFATKDKAQVSPRLRGGLIPLTETNSLTKNLSCNTSDSNSSCFQVLQRDNRAQIIKSQSCWTWTRCLLGAYEPTITCQQKIMRITTYIKQIPLCPLKYQPSFAQLQLQQ